MDTHGEAWGFGRALKETTGQLDMRLILGAGTRLNSEISLVPGAEQSLCPGWMLRLGLHRASAWDCWLGTEVLLLVKLVALTGPNLGCFLALCIELHGIGHFPLPCYHVHILDRKSDVWGG